MHHLDTRQLVETMIKICDAVHHAHQRGLIHRDLKPANILVDETGQPKILDFGVVRVTDSDTRSTIETNIGQLIGTLAYMSPEQALADPLELDTRTDVYALGVILYELLTGRMPYPVSKKLHEAIQSIREEDPAKLSAMNRSYRGDIETAGNEPQYVGGQVLSLKVDEVIPPKTFTFSPKGFKEVPAPATNRQR